MVRKVVKHGVEGDAGRLLLGEAEDARGDAAEGERAEMPPRRLLQARAVAGGEERTVALSGRSVLHDGPHGVEHKATRQVEGPGRLDAAGGLLVPLRPHELRAGEAELHARVGVNRVCYARTSYAGCEMFEICDMAW